VGEDEVESLSKNISEIFKYSKSSESNFYLFFLFIGFIVYLFYFIKKIYVNNLFNEEDENLQNAKDIILNHSISGVILIALVSAKLSFSTAPMLFGDSLITLTLIAAIPLIQPYIDKRFKNLIYFVILFFIIDSVKSYFWFNSNQYRFYLLFENILVIASLVFFTFPYRKTRKMKTKGFGKLLIQLAPVVYFLSTVSIFSNILGYTNLADMSLKVILQSSIITIIFYAVLMITGGIIIGLVHRFFCKKESFDARYKLAVERKALEVIRVITFLYWLFFFLKMIDIWNPLTLYIKDALTEPYVLGNITFTMGAVINFIFILVSSFLITRFISFVFDSGSPLKIFKLPKGIPAAISLIIRYFIIGFGFVLALSSLGLDLGKFNLMAGALGLGIGFGLQSIISNFVSGLILVFERPILPGDTIEVNNLLGKVNRIGVRSSNIRTFDGAEVVVPNNNLISNDLINWTLSDSMKRVEILVGTTYGSDPNEILKILNEVANKNKSVLKEPSPIALFSEFGDSSLNFKLRFWVPYERGLETKSEISIAIYNKFNELGIEIPFPQQDVHIKDINETQIDLKKLSLKKSKRISNSDEKKDERDILKS
jgi:small-conductance mechanosensitive channel